MHDLNAEFLRGQRLRREGRAQEALAVFDELVRRFPKVAGPRELRGVTLCGLDRFDEGLADVRAALEMEPRNADFHSDLGLLLFSLGHKEESRASLRRALMINPGHIEALVNSCLLLKEEGDFEGIERTARRLLTAQPGMPRANNHLANALLSLGRFAEAWPPFGLKAPEGFNPRDASVRVGVPHADRLPGAPSPIVLHGEQGLGDVLFFLRFAPRLKALGHRLAFWGDTRLHPVLARAGIFEHFLIPDATPAAGILVVWAGDLPGFLDATDPSAFPPPLPLAPDPDKLAAIRLELARFGPPPYVGLTWRAGSQRRRIVLSKEIDIAALGGALNGVRATFISLQRKPAPGECERLAAAIAAPVHDVSAVNDRLEDALAWLALLDEYVGVSNTNTHLRACAGRDSRVLVAWPPEWRWPRDAQRSPWYPGTALYRQSRDGDWSGALGCLRADLLSAL